MTRSTLPSYSVSESSQQSDGNDTISTEEQSVEPPAKPLRKSRTAKEAIKSIDFYLLASADFLMTLATPIVVSMIKVGHFR